MSATPSPMSVASGSPRQSPRSNRSSSNERSPRKHSRSPSRTPTPENMSDRSRSPLGSPRSKGSRTPSLHSSDGEEVVQEGKDIEDSGSEEDYYDDEDEENKGVFHRVFDLAFDDVPTSADGLMEDYYLVL